MGSQATRDETQLLIGGRWTDAGDGTYSAETSFNWDINSPITIEIARTMKSGIVDGMEEAVIEMLAAKQDLLRRERVLKSTLTAEAAPRRTLR